MPSTVRAVASIVNLQLTFSAEDGVYDRLSVLNRGSLHVSDSPRHGWFKQHWGVIPPFEVLMALYSQHVIFKTLNGSGSLHSDIQGDHRLFPCRLSGGTAVIQQSAGISFLCSVSMCAPLIFLSEATGGAYVVFHVPRYASKM